MGLRLTRSAGQKIVIADGLITVTITKIRDHANKVEVLIEAPADVNVVRGEKFQSQELPSGRVASIHGSDLSPLSAAGDKRTG
jgi:sRNA-binding carbon storage regulator CsrA